MKLNADMIRKYVKHQEKKERIVVQGDLFNQSISFGDNIPCLFQGQRQTNPLLRIDSKPGPLGPDIYSAVENYNYNN